jgi:formiminoglutamase/agmatinase
VTRGFDLWGVPYDGAANLGWPGCRYAPAKVRQALGWMTMRVQEGRVYSSDTQTTHAFGADLLRDRGDAEVVAHDLMATLEACAAAVADTVSTGRVPLVIGGDDSLLYGCLKGFHDAHEGTIGILHFDAHLDLLDESRNQGRYSQSSGMRRALELPRVSASHSVQVGVRNFNYPSSRRFVEEVGLTQLPAREFARIGIDAAARRIEQVIAGTDHVFWAFDIDVVDPAFAPGAGAHEPGGLTSLEVLECARLLAPRCDGFNIVEVNPLMDQHDMTSILAANLAYHMVVFGQEKSSSASSM